MIRIEADFNNMDEDGKVRLNNVRALEDIRKWEGELHDGLRVMLSVEGDFEVEGVLVFDKAWRATPDYRTLTYLDSGEETSKQVD